jgi:cytochrome c oxidase subunit IV
LTEHVTTPAAPPPVEAHHDDHNSPEYVAREKRKYLIVFGMLAILTVITVLVNRLDVPKGTAIAIALVIASVKAGLVAAYFMHLISERRLVYAVLGLTVFFFGMLLWGPWHHHYDAMGHDVNQPGVEDTTHSTTKTH